MEHTYQPEEAIIGANYDTYRNYFTSPPPLSPLRGLNNGKFPGLTPEAEWDGQAAGPQINVSQWMSSGNTVVDGYFYMSWNIARWISQQPQCLGVCSFLLKLLMECNVAFIHARHCAKINDIQSEKT